MRAGCVDTDRPGLEHVHGERLRVVPLHLGHAGADEVAGQPAPDEEDEAVEPRDPVPAVGERVDAELELLVERDGRGHSATLAWPLTGPNSRVLGRACATRGQAGVRPSSEQGQARGRTHVAVRDASRQDSVAR